MDPIRFDALTRALTDGHERQPTRRSVMALLAGGLVAAGILNAPETAAKKHRRKKKCKGGKKKCSGTCVDALSDPSNCGTCGNVCGGGQRCQEGTCVGGGCTPNCADKACGSDGCGGSCGTCPAGQSCQSGTCVDGGCTPSCAGKQCGDDGCGDSCGSCPSGQLCRDNGTCVAGGGGGCDDIDCPANTVCENGECITAPNRCSGPTGICNADPTPCGTAATGETCGCEQTVEGNNFCANAVDACTTVECSTTQDCEDTVGFHFFCQEAKTNAQGQFCGCGFGMATGRVCVAECDNPS